MLAFHSKGLLGAVLAGALAGIVTAILTGHVEIGWVIVVVVTWFSVVLLTGAVRLLGTTYTVTDQRLTIQTGLLAREVHHTRLQRVQNVSSRQSLRQRMMSIGDVVFDTAGEQGFNFSFQGVADPQAIVRTVDRAMREKQAAGWL